jgi:hypothetical protein
VRRWSTKARRLRWCHTGSCLCERPAGLRVEAACSMSWGLPRYALGFTTATSMETWFRQPRSSGVVVLSCEALRHHRAAGAGPTSLHMVPGLLVNGVLDTANTHQLTNWSSDRIQ